MRRPIGIEQPLGIDRRVDLRRRQRRMAEQFLDRTQIAAARQQVGCERMSQRCLLYTSDAADE